MTDTERNRVKAICEVAGVAEIDDLSDGFHTFRQLYYQRMMLFATIVKQNKDKAWKSLRHEDGELCFGGGWFIVGIDTPEGSYTYHYEDNYFSLFDCEELEYSKHWDGHTEKDVTRLLSLPSVQPKERTETHACDCISRAEAIELKPEFLNPNVNRETKEQTAIDRAYARGWNSCNTHWIKEIIEDLPSAQPEQKWIPCGERLPEEKDAGILKKLGTSKRSEYVLATVEVKGERMTVTACTYDGEWHWDKKYAFPDYKIVAWMPLPEPYKERREE